MGLLHGPGYDTNLFKIMLAQARAMKSTCSNDCGGGAVRVGFQGAKNRLDEGEDLNDILANAVK